ncbi:hypothetical protein [Streptomyces sp. NPDC004546]|uniref:hypothetical protein n=1 Tax=Streptomyces sp. NPDC004546 TaxID=3154282 RepID=UPI0033B87E68
MPTARPEKSSTRHRSCPPRPRATASSRAPWSAQPAEPRTPSDRWRYAYDPLGRRISEHRVAEDGSATGRTAFQ